VICRLRRREHLAILCEGALNGLGKKVDYPQGLSLSHKESQKANTPADSSQRTAFFTSAVIFASSAAVNFISAYEFGHMAPSSRFALSLKPSV
jgi:hypothetical protein